MIIATRDMKMLFIHSGKPISKQRHRMVGKFAYDPQAKLKNEIKFDFANQYRSQGYLNALEGSFSALVDISYEVPKSWANKAKQTAYYKTSRPDIDNIVKFYFDVLNGIAYHDDSQVVSIFSQKLYSNKNEVAVKLFRLKDNMINEHAITYKDILSVDQINYMAKKANRLGLSKRQLVRVYQQEDEEGTHVYFEVDNLEGR